MNATTAIAIRDDQVTFDEFQRKALAHMGVERATDADLAIFMHQCKRTGLDPVARQIHMIGRNSKNQRTQQWETKFTIQTGIDGYRLIARRAAGREGYGYEDTLWCGPDGVWSSIWLEDTPPVAAKVVVVRGGQRFPAVARYKAYVQTKKDGEPNSIWAQRDAEQLEKCAEALALRKAFPQDLSGIYTDDEMRAQQDETAHEPAPVKAAGLDAIRQSLTTEPGPTPMNDDTVDAEVVEETGEAITATTRGRMFALFTERGITDADQQRAGMSKVLGRTVESRADLTEADGQAIIASLEGRLA